MINLLQLLTLELYQMVFIASILYIIYNIVKLIIAFYNTLILGDMETKYILTPMRQTYLLISTTIILSFLI